MTVELRNETTDPVAVGDLVALADFVMEQLLLDPATELSVVCVEPDDIALLHQEWLDEPGPTDVMSFPMDELRPGVPGEPRPQGMLGDVVLCPRVAAAQAAAAGHPPEHELRILLTHGILHLLGFDHAEPEDEAQMFGLQRSLVEQFERARPGR